MKTTFSFFLFFVGLTAVGQNTEILPSHTSSTFVQADSVNASKFSGDSLFIQNIRMDGLATDVSKPMFFGTNGDLGTKSSTMSITVPAADFRPELISPVDAAGSPILGQIAIFNNGDIQGYNSLYSLIAPLYISVDNLKSNIKVTEIEVCVLDRNQDADLYAGLYSTGLLGSSPSAKSTVLRMETNSTTGTLNNNFRCFKADKLNDDFLLNNELHGYWIRVLPKHKDLNSIEDSPGPEQVVTWPSSTDYVNGALKLMHVRIFYNYE